MIENGKAWRRLAWPVLKWATLSGLVLGFVAGTLSYVSGNTISVNGTAIAGWYGVWLLTFALGIGGFCFGLIWALVFRALGDAAKG